MFDLSGTCEWGSFWESLSNSSFKRIFFAQHATPSSVTCIIDLWQKSNCSGSFEFGNYQAARKFSMSGSHCFSTYRTQCEHTSICYFWCVVWIQFMLSNDLKNLLGKVLSTKNYKFMLNVRICNSSSFSTNRT